MIILEGASIDNESGCSQSLMSWANESGPDDAVLHNPEGCWVTEQAFIALTERIWKRLLLRYLDLLYKIEVVIIEVAQTSRGSMK